jgi:hypothetical protein
VHERVVACNDGLDDDGDGRTDLADPGCENDADPSEDDGPGGPPGCADGIDGDADGLVDWPQDPGCTAAGDPDERLYCRHADPIPTVGHAGASLRVDTWRAGDHARGSCAPAGPGGGERVLRLHVEVPSAVEVVARNATFDPVVYVRAACDAPEAELACADGGRTPVASVRLPQLFPGDYFVFVDTASGLGGRADVDVAVTPLR